MKKNVGFTDSLVRIILAGVIFALGIIYGSWWALLGFIPLLTGVFSYCPLYTVFGINTCKVKKKK